MRVTLPLAKNFDQMTEYFFLFLGLIILLAGGKFLVDGASSLAVKLGLSTGVIGLTIVAFGTSTPELLVSVYAALNGNADISLGNVIGSNIANLALVLGITGLIYPIMISRSHLRFDYSVMILTSVLLFVFSLNLQISFLEGLLLFLGFIGFNWYLFKGAWGGMESTNEDQEGIKEYSWIISGGLLFLGIVGLYVGSELLVSNAVEISRSYGISERIIGITIIAIGTSLPELIASVFAALKHRTDLAIGNLLGSNIMNVLSILGITALIKPIEVSEEFIKTDFIWMLGISFLLLPLMKTRMRISRVEGIILLICYGSYLLFLL